MTKPDPRKMTKIVMEEMREQGIDEMWLYYQMSRDNPEKLERVVRSLLKLK